MRRFLILVALGLAALAANPAEAASPTRDFALGKNAENQACRAVARFDPAPGVQAVDIYCGDWERPSGRAAIYDRPAEGEAALVALCQGAVTPLTVAEFAESSQIVCGQADGGARRFGLRARRGAKLVVGAAYPADWPSLLSAAKVLAGAMPRQAVAQAARGETPGMEEIRAVYPDGPPGQQAAVNYELMRRRAYEHNTVWSFAASERDFSELLRAHKATAPDDLAGEAEILAEVGLNFSGASRFDDARSSLERAQAEATAAHDELLVSKILNYRALDALNQRKFAQALDLALQGNQARERLAGGSGRRGQQTLSAADAGRIEGRDAGAPGRSLLSSLGETSPATRSAVLSAQAYYVAGVAARAMRRPDAMTYLNQASAQLQNVDQPPGWLLGQIADERAELRLVAGDNRAAEAEARTGLTLLRAAGAGTRSEAHLWLTLERAQAAAGKTGEALESGRRGVAIFAQQTETPGMPADVAGRHLSTLLAAWTASSDPGLAGEYFETLALVWDGAAARSATQLAARLALTQDGGQARAYQDAERAYRAAVTVQQRLQGAESSAEAAQADKAVQAAAARLTAAEAALRQSAPRYLELLSPRAAVGDLQGVLRPDEGYLRVVLGSDGGYGVLVTKTGVRPYAIALSAADAERLAAGFRRSTAVRRSGLPDFDLASSGALYAGVLGPVASDLAGLKALQVDVGGALASVPFAALVAAPPSGTALKKVTDDQDYTQVDWLARHVAVANALGPASFVRLRKTAPSTADNHVAIFGDFQPDPAGVAARLAHLQGLSTVCQGEVENALARLGGLPDTVQEARGVAALFGDRARLRLGGQFTDADFLKSPEVGDAGVLLLATHGVLGLSDCFQEPALLTSLAADGSGLIQASALLDRKLKARLVVLSACDTAGGGKLDAARSGLADGGEALSGLARGFIYSGASSVLATAWKVDSASSAQQIHAFFDESGKPGVTLMDALAASQRRLYSTAETGHPFYWAAFMLIGDGSVSLGR